MNKYFIFFFFYSIKNDRFIDLVQQLGNIFSTENKPPEDVAKIFYIPFQRATKFSKFINTGGVLYEKYLNCRKSFIKNELISTQDCLDEGILMFFFRLSFNNQVNVNRMYSL